MLITAAARATATSRVTAAKTTNGGIVRGRKVAVTKTTVSTFYQQPYPVQSTHVLIILNYDNLSLLKQDSLNALQQNRNQTIIHEYRSSKGEFHFKLLLFHVKFSE